MLTDETKVFTESKMRPTKTKTCYLQSRMVEVQKCYGASGSRCLDCMHSITKSADY